MAEITPDVAARGHDEWNKFVASNPEFTGIQTYPELKHFLTLHPDLEHLVGTQQYTDINIASSFIPSTALPTEYTDASAAFLHQGEPIGTEAAGLAVEGGAGFFEAMLNKPELMEDDFGYKAIRQEKEENFRNERERFLKDSRKGGKSYNALSTAEKQKIDDTLLQGSKFSKEAELDYLYGNLETGEESILERETRDAFNERLDNEQHKKFGDPLERIRKKRERWNKYDSADAGDVNKDLEIKRFQYELAQAKLARADHRFEIWRRSNHNGTWNQFTASNEYISLMGKLDHHSMNNYIKRHPRNALKYAKQAQEIQEKNPDAKIHPYLKNITDAVGRNKNFFQKEFPEEYLDFFPNNRPEEFSSFSPEERRGENGGTNSFHFPSQTAAQNNQKNSVLGNINQKAQQAKNTLNRVGGIAKDAKELIDIAQKAKFFANPPVLIAIGISITLLLIIVIIISITSSNQSASDTQSPQGLSCNTPSSGNITSDMASLGFTINGDIYKSAPPPGIGTNIIAQQQSDINQALYTITCEIFQVTTFRNKIPITANNIISIFNYPATNKPECSAEPLNISTLQQSVILYKLQNCTTNQKQYLIAQQLASLIAKAMTNEELNNFKNTISPDTALTLPDCDNGNIQNRNGQQACFADTIATFIVNNQASFSYGKTTFSGGRHGGWSVVTADDARQAASLGVNYIMPYQFGPGTFSVDASTKFLDLGTEENTVLVQNHMKTILDLHTLITCGGIDTSRITYLVTKYWTSPVLAGYWTRDDNPHCGLTKSLIQAYQLIHSIDKNPQHVVIPGFGETYNLSLDYAPGMADVLGFYPYPAFGTPPETEVAQMLALVKSRTPSGQTPPPFIGLYQAYYTPGGSPRSLNNIEKDVQSFLDNGAISVAAFGWREVDGGQYIVGDNTGQLANIVKGVSGYLSTH